MSFGMSCRSHGFRDLRKASPHCTSQTSLECATARACGASLGMAPVYQVDTGDTDTCIIISGRVRGAHVAHNVQTTCMLCCWA